MRACSLKKDFCKTTRQIKAKFKIFCEMSTNFFMGHTEILGNLIFFKGIEIYQ